MRRSFFRGPLMLTALVLTTTACDNPTTTTPTPVDPSSLVLITDTFSGTITLNGSVVYPFVVNAAGTVSATVTAIDPNPDGTAAIGLSLGVWNGTACGSIALDNPSAFTGYIMLATVAGAGTLCARVADPNGKLTNPLNYTLVVVHF